ncbi:MAG: hypothetical protein A3G20_08215 [Acidobacteria bacterium RIFCSPLOWO2_12_FULL_59_11]|nr:MAG: hypothetical protein A3G20_08215 [Acidobacteria bacterium RIFCSPLOWO2_12_FULL_59_11]
MNVSYRDRHERNFIALIGAMAIVVGTLTAILNISEDNYNSAGALLIPGLILAVSLVLPTLLKIRNDARRLLRGENILLYGLVYWVLLDILQGLVPMTAGPEAIVAAFALLGVAALGFWVGASYGFELKVNFLVEEALRPLSDGRLFLLTLIAFLLGSWDFFYRSGFDIGLVFESLQAARFEAPWQRDQLGDWSAFSQHLQYFGFMVPALAVLTYLRRGPLHLPTLASLVMAITILVFNGQGGGRRIVGAMMLAGMFCWIIYVRRIKLKQFLIAVSVGAGILGLLQFMLLWRNVGIADVSSALGEFEYIHVDDNFVHIAEMLEFVPDIYPYVGWQYVLYTIVRPIPRVLWPGKPTDSGFDLAEALGIHGTVFAITAPGEFFVSHGYIAVFLGSWVYGKLATAVNSLFGEFGKPVNPVFPALGLVWLFVGIRSMVEIILMGYVILFAFLLSRAMDIVDSIATGVRARGSRAR